MRLRWGVVVITVAVSAGCDRSAQSEEDPNSSRSPAGASSAAPAAETGPCTLLEPKVVANLAGEQLDGGETTIPGSDLPSCAYGRLDEVGVQVTQVPASEWARALPEIVDQFKAMGGLEDPNLLRQLEDGAELVERGDTIAPDQACSLFSDMLELRDGVAGLDRDLAYLPGREDPQAVTAQACIGGKFTSIVVGRPDLEVGSKVEAALGKALQEIT